MPVYIDQTGHSITIDTPPQRIISLVPSQTELLYDLGMDPEVIGITKFCIHPESWFRHKTRVGGTKQLNIELIRSLQPDLIIANKEENVKEQIEQLAADYRVWISDISTLEDAYKMIREIGLMTGRSVPAQELVNDIRNKFAALSLASLKKACYLIWQKPYMTVGGDTFIHTQMEAAGFINLFAAEKRYPAISLEELKAAKPEYLLLSSEPFPFNEKHKAELANEFPDTEIILVDGELFSWYGSRLRLAPAYFLQLQEQMK
jgi:ABC-type Fe3+-hydroxamate transport system substrate-binding protein